MMERMRYRTRHKVLKEKPRSRLLRLSPSRANVHNKNDFMSLLGLTRNFQVASNESNPNANPNSSLLKSCNVVIMCSQCNVCHKWFKSSYDAQKHKTFHDDFSQEVRRKRRKSILRRKPKAKERNFVGKENLQMKHLNGKNEDEMKKEKSNEVEILLVNNENGKKVMKNGAKMQHNVRFKNSYLVRSEVANEEDDDIQFCYEIKYDKEEKRREKEDDDCEIVCQVIKDKNNREIKINEWEKEKKVEDERRTIMFKEIRQISLVATEQQNVMFKVKPVLLTYIVNQPEVQPISQFSSPNRISSTFSQVPTHPSVTKNLYNKPWQKIGRIGSCAKEQVPKKVNNCDSDSDILILT